MNSGFPAGNPIANIFIIIVGVLTIAASIVLGFFAFMIIGGIVLVMASVIALRVWWFNRKLRWRAPGGVSQRRKPVDGVIEGEYQVVAEDEQGE